MSGLLYEVDIHLALCVLGQRTEQPLFCRQKRGPLRPHLSTQLHLAGTMAANVERELTCAVSFVLHNTYLTMGPVRLLTTISKDMLRHLPPSNRPTRLPPYILRIMCEIVV